MKTAGRWMSLSPSRLRERGGAKDRGRVRGDRRRVRGLAGVATRRDGNSLRLGTAADRNKEGRCATPPTSGAAATLDGGK